MAICTCYKILLIISHSFCLILWTLNRMKIHEVKNIKYFKDLIILLNSYFNFSDPHKEI